MSIVYGVKSNATRGAIRALKAAGVETPLAGEHFEVVACAGGYEFLDIRPSVIEAAALENTAELEVAGILVADAMAALEEEGALDACKPALIDTGTFVYEEPKAFYQDLTGVDVSTKPFTIEELPPTPYSVVEGLKFADLFPNGVNIVYSVADGEGEDAKWEEGVGVISALVPAPLVDDSVIAAIYAMASARATRPAPKKSRGWMALYETMAAKGQMPPRHLVTSLVNMHMQKHFDALHAMATAHDREGLLSYPLKGSNSYAQECRRWRDLLVKAVDALPVPIAA